MPSNDIRPSKDIRAVEPDPDDEELQTEQPILDDDAWIDSDVPPAARSLLTPITAVLVALLLLVVGMFAGVLVDRHFGSESSSNSLISQLVGGSFGLSATPGGSKASAGGVASRLGVGGPGKLTLGQVDIVDGKRLTVSGLTGNKIQVRTGQATTVIGVEAKPASTLKPGDTVVIKGAKTDSGVVDASTIILPGQGGISALLGSGLSGGGGIGELLGGTK